MTGHHAIPITPANDGVRRTMLVVVIGTFGFHVKVRLRHVAYLEVPNEVTVSRRESVRAPTGVVRSSYKDSHVTTAIADTRKTKFVRRGPRDRFHSLVKRIILVGRLPIIPTRNVNVRAPPRGRTDLLSAPTVSLRLLRRAFLGLTKGTSGQNESNVVLLRRFFVRQHGPISPGVSTYVSVAVKSVLDRVIRFLSSLTFRLLTNNPLDRLVRGPLGVYHHAFVLLTFVNIISLCNTTRQFKGEFQLVVKGAPFLEDYYFLLPDVSKDTVRKGQEFVQHEAVTPELEQQFFHFQIDLKDNFLLQLAVIFNVHVNLYPLSNNYKFLLVTQEL